MKHRLLRRFRQLAILEAINVFLLPMAYINACINAHQPFGAKAVVAMVVNGILLLQGAYWWHTCRRQLQGESIIHTIPTFRRLRVMAALSLVASTVAVVSIPALSNADRWGAIGFLSLAILEYINYYVVQLMYDNPADWRYLLQHKRLKPASLGTFIANQH